MAHSSTFVPLQFERLPAAEQRQRLTAFHATMAARRSVRQFDPHPVPRAVLEAAVAVAGRAPSGANQQPWRYVVVSDAATKRRLRQAAESEAGTAKPYLEEAPHLIVAFAEQYGLVPAAQGGAQTKEKRYYPRESTGISVSFLLAALQHAGVATLLHGPMAAAPEILLRPANEICFLVLAVGYAQAAAKPPRITRRAAHDVIIGVSGLSTTPRVAAQELPAAPTAAEQLARVQRFAQRMRTRRVVRDFSGEPVPVDLLTEAILAATTAPSAGHRQPWRFAVVSDPGLKRELRVAAEHEEKLLYEERITDEWRAALAPLGTDWHKEYLEIVPHVIICFRLAVAQGTSAPYPDGTDNLSQYASLESATLAAGLLIAAIHHAGLVTLTHTPSPMGFARELLGRPKDERPFLVLPVGYPAPGCRVPDIDKKPLSEILTFFGEDDRP